MRGKANLVARNTKQKDAIRAALVETGRPLSPEEVLSYAQRSVMDLSIATVYRNLKIMVEEKWLTAVQLPGELPDTRFRVRHTTITSGVTTAERYTSWKDARRG